jgi:hypothetical protein
LRKFDFVEEKFPAYNEDLMKKADGFLVDVALYDDHCETARTKFKAKNNPIFKPKLIPQLIGLNGYIPTYLCCLNTYRMIVVYHQVRKKQQELNSR